MENKPMTNAEIDQFIAATHASTLWSDSEKYQLIQKYEAARPKGTSIALATEEELDKVFGSLSDASMASRQPKVKAEKDKTDHERILDQICKLL